MEPSTQPQNKSPWNNPYLVLVPFYCICILLLGANLFRDRCCQEVQQQIQASDRHGLQELQEINTRLSQIQRHLEGRDKGITVEPNIPIPTEIPGVEVGDTLADFGIDVLTELLVNRIASFFESPEQKPMVKNEIRKVVNNYFRAELCPQKNSGELTIYFDIRSAKVPASGRQLIESIRGFVRKHPGQRITISGFADRVGQPTYNRELAMRRSKAVADLMAGLPAQIDIEPIEGEDHLLVVTADEVSEPRNRTVVIHWKAEPKQDPGAGPRGVGHGGARH